MAIWKYDKRSVNNANFVYFGVCLESADTPEARVGQAHSQRNLGLFSFPNYTSSIFISYIFVHIVNGLIIFIMEISYFVS